MKASQAEKEGANLGAIDSLFNRLFPVNSRIATGTIFGVWGAYFLAASLRVLYVDLGNADAVFVQRILMTSLCIFFSWLLYRWLLMVREGDIILSVLVIALPSVILANIAAIADQIIFDHSAELFDFSYLLEPIDFQAFNWTYVLDEAFTRYFIFVSWGALYLAMSHSREVQRFVARSRQLEQVNKESELRALRYQLNPHFVFNALNSVSSLIIDEKNKQAERLVDGLADYMRIVLDDDGEHMVGVEKEIEQQVRYLEIEKVRFPERLRYEVHIDEAVRQWKIPALIIQPLIENAIKFGVAPSDKPVRILISATEEAGRLKLTVANDGRMTTAVDNSAGTGTGLSNIKERLAAVFGDSAALITANGDEGLAIASIVLPNTEYVFDGS